MQTIETIITVLADGSITTPPHLGLPPGKHRAVLVVEALITSATPKSPLKLKMLEVPGWPVDARFRREDMYDDE